MPRDQHGHADPHGHHRDVEQRESAHAPSQHFESHEHDTGLQQISRAHKERVGGGLAFVLGVAIGGQKQRVAIARALVHNPKLIVCDEPTSALDHETGHTVMELLKGVALQEDRSLVIVTHDARIFNFADRIAEMDDGHMVKVVDSTKAISVSNQETL